MSFSRESVVTWKVTSKTQRHHATHSVKSEKAKMSRASDEVLKQRFLLLAQSWTPHHHLGTLTLTLTLKPPSGDIEIMNFGQTPPPTSS